MTDSYYIQDSRSYLGNSMVWWRLGGGYTSDLSKAEVFTHVAAMRQHACRDSDRPWPKEYIDQKTQPTVDMQYCNRNEAEEWMSTQHS